MRGIQSIEDPIAFLWACAIAYLLEFSLSLAFFRGFYALRERGLASAILRRSGRSIHRAWNPPFELEFEGLDSTWRGSDDPARSTRS